MRSRAPPTTSPTRGRAATRSGCGCSTGWRCRLRRRRRRAPTSRRPATASRPTASRSSVALGATMREKRLPLPLFEDLLSAFRQDVSVTRYATWADLLDYCRRSANPIGRLVLRIAGYRERQPRRLVRRRLHGAAADQLLAGPGGRPRARPRLRAAGGAARARRPEDDLAGPGLSQEWRASLAAVVARTRALFVDGQAGVRRRARPAALRAARHLARRHAHSRSARTPASMPCVSARASGAAMCRGSPGG